MFDDMSAFVRVIEAGSLTGAAKRLGIAKSAVSRRVSQLEGRLGAALLHRDSRRLSPTEAGREFYGRARRILADVSEAEDTVRGLSGELRGKLRVAAPMAFGLRYISSAVVDFMVERPGVEVVVDLDDRFVDLVGEGHDLAIRIGGSRDSGLVSRPVAPCRFVVCASPRYLGAKGTPATPDDLADHECLSHANRPPAEQWRFRTGGEWRSVRVAGRLNANNSDVLMEAAVAGLGIAVLPTFIAGEAISRGDLRVVLADFPLEAYGVHAVWPPGRGPSAKSRAFVDFLAGRFEGASDWSGEGGSALHPPDGMRVVAPPGREPG